MYETMLSSLGLCIKTSEIVSVTPVIHIAVRHSMDIGWHRKAHFHALSYCDSSALLAGPRAINGKATVRGTIHLDFRLKLSLT
jgi:hypothetical protein